LIKKTKEILRQFNFDYIFCKLITVDNYSNIYCATKGKEDIKKIVIINGYNGRESSCITPQEDLLSNRAGFILDDFGNIICTDTDDCPAKFYIDGTTKLDVLGNDANQQPFKLFQNGVLQGVLTETMTLSKKDGSLYCVTDSGFFKRIQGVTVTAASINKIALDYKNLISMSAPYQLNILPTCIGDIYFMLHTEIISCRAPTLLTCK